MFSIILLESSDDRKTMLDYLSIKPFKFDVIGYSIVCLLDDIREHSTLYNYMNVNLVRAGRIITVGNFDNGYEDYVPAKSPISLR